MLSEPTPRKPTCSLASPSAVELPALFRQSLQPWRGRPPLAVLRVKALHCLVHFIEPHGLGIEHRAAAKTGKAIAVDIDDVDIGCAQRDALLENLRAGVDKRVDATLDDFLVADFAPLNSSFGGCLYDQILDDRIGNRRAAARPVAIPAGAGLLTKTAHLADPIGDLRVAQMRRPCRRLALADVPADIEAGKIAHAERPHREAEVLDRLVDLLRQCALLQ